MKQTRPLRVAMVHYRDDAMTGGSLRVGETIANHLDPQRVSAEMVFAYGDAGPVAKRAKIPCHFIGATGPKDFLAWPRARALFNRLNPDIIHFQDGIVWLRLALLGTSPKTLLHIHGRVAEIEGTQESRKHPVPATTLLRVYLKSTAAQVCINHGARDALLDLGWIDSARSCVVYNSTDVSRFGRLPDRTSARTALGLPREALLLGTVARLVWEKGCADLLSIIERLPARWHGVLCGDGPERENLRHMCEQRGLTHRIHFIGTQADVLPVYAALDGYAFVSHYEPFGLVAAEAMAAGLPVFGIESEGEFNEPGYPLFGDVPAFMVPFVRNGDYVRDVPEQVLGRVAQTVTDYGEHPERYSQVITRAQLWVSSCFDAPIQAEAMTRVYEHFLATGSMPQVELNKFYETRIARARQLLAPPRGAARVAASA